MNIIIYELPQLDNSIIKLIKKKGFGPSFSRFLAQPQFKNGFNHYIHKAKDKMAFQDDPKYKNKHFYLVTNPFEHTITNNAKDKLDIASYSKIYFDITNNKVNIVSRAFYKLWEILIMFNNKLFSKKKSIISAHLAEAPGSFVQSLIFFREKFYKLDEYKNDEHYVISIAEEGVPSFRKDFKSEYSKVKIYEQDGGDLTSIASINKFVKFSKKADFITADGGFIWKDENYQEQEAYRLIIGEILTAIKIQAEDGSFIIKLFEIYTDNTIKIISILASCYKKVFITKPFTSRQSNSEKYIVCIGFQSSKVDENIIIELEKLLEQMNDMENKELFVSNILPEYEIDENIKITINFSSILLSNLQHVAINKMKKYVDSGNYYGDQYNQYLEEQQKANDFWTATFYPIDLKDMKVVIKNFDNIINTTLQTSEEQLKDYSKRLKYSV
jgi:23S rRNA U2552 (ribose-2'-O)-methylase RlmE/FtsJ